MPQVPDIPLSVTPLQGLPNARFSADAPLEAFGGGASLDRVDQAEQRLGSTIHDIGQEQKNNADQLAVISASRQAMELQSSLQVQTSKMLGKDSLGAPDFVQKNWADGVSKISSGLSNDQQRLAFSHYANSSYGELYKSTNLHVAGQIKEFDNHETQSLLDASKNNAVLNAYDDDRVQDELDKQHAALQTWANRNGIPADSVQFKDRVQQTQSSTLAGVIESRLTAGQDEAAQDLFESSKDGMTAADILTTQKRLETSKNLAISMQTWQDVKGMTLANGDPDEAKMQSSIMSREDLSTEQKLKVLDFVQSQAKIATYERRAHDAANERGLLNSALEARKSGAPLEQALKLVDNYQWDNKSQEVMQKQVKEIYAPPSYKSNVDKVLALSDGIRQGTVSEGDIKQAYLQQDADDKDYRMLREQLSRKQQQGVSADEKNAWDKVKTLAAATYPKDSETQKNFLNTVRTLGHGKTPDQIWDIAQKETKDDPSTKSGWIFTSYQPQWKTDMARANANSLAMGKLQNDLGKSVVTAIGQGSLHQKATAGAGPAYPNAKWGYGDVDAFAQNFGGYDKIKTGTPVNNAVQSLIKLGKVATPANVNALLQKFPDGIY